MDDLFTQVRSHANIVGKPISHIEGRKVVAILPTTSIFQSFFKSCSIPIQISPNFIAKDPFHNIQSPVSNILAMLYIMTVWHQAITRTNDCLVHWRIFTLIYYSRCLTHWDRHKMSVTSQATYSNAFSVMKMYGFRLIYHWIIFLRVQLTIFHYWFRQYHLNWGWLFYTDAYMCHAASMS